MNLTFVTPRRELRPYIEAFWVFESPSGFPAIERNIVVPNGCAKLVIPHENALIAESGGASSTSNEHNLYLVGTHDVSALLRSSQQPTSFITIEFTPQGAFSIFGIPMAETVNRVWETDALLSRWSRPVRAALNGHEHLAQKIAVIQEQLLYLLQQSERRNGIVDYCVQSLRATHGLISVQELARRTGYSRRYIDKLFRKHVGVAPKTLAGLYRFHRFYRKWVEAASFEMIRDELYELYYDQSHFSKEFRRVTGVPLTEFRGSISNEFDRRLLQQ